LFVFVPGVEQKDKKAEESRGEPPDKKFAEIVADGYIIKHGKEWKQNGHGPEGNVGPLVKQVLQFLMIYGAVFWFDIVHFAMEMKNDAEHF